MAVVTVGSDEDRAVDGPVVVVDRLEAFGVEVLAGAVNRPVQVRNGGLYLRGLIEQGARKEQLSRVVDEKVKHQAATFSSVVVVSSSVTLIPSLNLTPASTSPTSSWPLNRRQRSWAASKSL